jgi:serine/threonine protein phosphatase PrpC
MLRFHFSARSDVGIQRELNEDSGLASEQLLVVADGLGGHAAGELASSTAISVMNSTNLEGLTADQVSKRLAGTTKELSRKLLEQSGNYTERSGLGTTLSMAYLVKGEKVAVFSIGDSRVYLGRDGSLSQLTKDHTYVQELIELGELSQEEARVHPKRSLLTQAIDGITPASGDFAVLDIVAGDKFLVCTDGLTAVVDDHEIMNVIEKLEPAAAVAKLVDIALDRGAPDNVTVIVAEAIQSTEAGGSAPIVVGAAALKGNRENLAALEFPNDQVPTLEKAPQQLKGFNRQSSQPNQGFGTKRNRFRLIAITVLLTMAFALVGLYAALLGTQLFIGVENGQVALFRGIPQSIAFVELNRPLRVSTLNISDLPTFEQQQISGGISVTSEASGLELIEQLQTRLAQER